MAQQNPPQHQASGDGPGGESHPLVEVLPVVEMAVESLAPGLFPSATGTLAPEEVDTLWHLFRVIAATWGEPGDDPTIQRSQWYEFVELRTQQVPSYLAEYRSAVGILGELLAQGGEGTLGRLLTGPNTPTGGPPSSRLTHLKVYVVDEFIRVWLATGGFRAYGASNYNGYVSGSRFGIRPPYRLVAHPSEIGPGGGVVDRVESRDTGTGRA